jgi:hypothetical protein
VFFLRQVNCLTSPERELTEAFRVLVFGVMVNPMPIAIYEAFWAFAAWGQELRRAIYEEAFQLVIVSIDEVDFVITINPQWFINYNEAVEEDLAPITAECPCIGF